MYYKTANSLHGQTAPAPSHCHCQRKSIVRCYNSASSSSMLMTTCCNFLRSVVVVVFTCCLVVIDVLRVCMFCYACSCLVRPTGSLYYSIPALLPAVSISSATHFIEMHCISWPLFFVLLFNYNKNLNLNESDTTCAKSPPSRLLLSAFCLTHSSFVRTSFIDGPKLYTGSRQHHRVVADLIQPTFVYNNLHQLSVERFEIQCTRPRSEVSDCTHHDLLVARGVSVTTLP